MINTSEQTNHTSDFTKGKYTYNTPKVIVPHIANKACKAHSQSQSSLAKNNIVKIEGNSTTKFNFFDSFR